MDNNSMFPLEVSKADFYYIYPFVLDFELLVTLDNKNSYLQIWASGESGGQAKDLWTQFPLQMGLPESRLGFPPIMPYKAIADEFGHFEKTHVAGSKLKLIGRHEKGENGEMKTCTNVGASKTFIARECGNGALTYKLTLERSDFSQSTADLLNPIIRLVPRLPDQESLDEGEHILEGGIFGDDKKTLFGHVRTELENLEKLLEECFKKKNSKKKSPREDIEGEQHIWEDREVLFAEDGENRPWGLNRPIVQPFAFIVLYLGEGTYDYDAVRKLLDYLSEGEEEAEEKAKEVRIEIAKAILSIIYRFHNLNNYWILPPPTGTHLLNINRILNVNDYVTCFFHHTTILAVIDNSNRDERHLFAKQFAEKYVIRAILNAVESAVTRVHFAFILDAILDNQIKNLGRASFDELPLFSEQLAKTKSQMARFLQNIGQYMKGGNLGSEILALINEVLSVESLEKKLNDKIRLATDALLDYTRYKFYKRHDR